MKILIEEKDRPEKTKTYPWIGDSDGDIVLFFKPQEGIVLRHRIYNIGHFGDNWFEHLFKPFLGTISMSNEE